MISMGILLIFFGTHYYKGTFVSTSAYAQIAATIDGTPISLREIDQHLAIPFSKKKIDIYKQRLAQLEHLLLEKEAQQRGISVSELS